MRRDAAGHPGIFGILHLTYYVLGHTKTKLYGSMGIGTQGMSGNVFSERLIDLQTVRKAKQ